MEKEKDNNIDDKLTIVGPEPINNTQSKQKKVNIEAFLLMAKYNTELAQLIFSDRKKAIEQSGIKFSNTEKLILTTVSNEQLKKNIETLSLPGITKKSLPSWKVAASVIVLISSILSGIIQACYLPTTGITTDGITPSETIQTTPEPTPSATPLSPTPLGTIPSETPQETPEPTPSETPDHPITFGVIPSNIDPT